MARLLWLSHVLPHPPKGGVLQRSYHLIRGAAAVHDVELVTFRQRAFHPDVESVGESVDALAAHLTVRAVVDLPVERGRAARSWELVRSGFTPAPFTVRWNASREMDATLAELARTAHFDLVHFDTVGMLQYRHHFPGAAWVLNHHNIESQMMRQRIPHAPLALRPYLWWEALRLERWERIHGGEADLHLVVSELDRARLLEILPGASAEVVENAVDTESFRPLGSPKRAGRVVFVGRIDAYANLAAARWLRDEIWPEVLRHRPDASLGIVGRSPPEEILAWGRATPSVEVTGFVDDVRLSFDEAEVFVCPIFQGGGTRLKVLDAMAMGLPVVSHEMALEGLDVTPGEHVLSGRTGREIADAVVRLLADPARARRMGEAGRERVDGLYSTRAVHKHLNEAYARSLASAGRRSR